MRVALINGQCNDNEDVTCNMSRDENAVTATYNDAIEITLVDLQRNQITIYRNAFNTRW